jgi:hypothetical protein
VYSLGNYTTRFHNVFSKRSLVHGSECCTLRSRDEQRIEAAQRRFVRGLKGVTRSYRQRNDDIRNVSEVNKMSDDAEEYQEK